MLPRRELSRAVLIGTSDFERSDSLPNLPAIGNNLVDLRAALTDDEAGILGWEQCVVVDSPDTPSSLIGRLRSAARIAEDLLLVYYAGHGIRVGDREELYLTVRHSRADSPLDTCVPFDWVRDVVGSSPARTKLLILDCCYSGMALGAMSAGGVDGRQIEITGTTVITSAPRNSVSHSPPGERHTAFTGELITLLRSGSPLPEEPLTVSTLFLSLQAAMARRDLPQPKMRSDDTSGSLQLRQFQPPAPPPMVASMLAPVTVPDVIPAPAAIVPPEPEPPAASELERLAEFVPTTVADPELELEQQPELDPPALPEPDRPAELVPVAEADPVPEPDLPAESDSEPLAEVSAAESEPVVEAASAEPEQESEPSPEFVPVTEFEPVAATSLAEPEPVAVLAPVADPEPVAAAVSAEPEPTAIAEPQPTVDVMPVAAFHPMPTAPAPVWSPVPSATFGPIAWPRQEADTISFARPAPAGRRARVALVYLRLVGAIVLAFFADSAVGGFAGMAFAERTPTMTGTTEIGMGIGGTVVGVAIAVPLLLGIRKGRWAPLEDVAPVLAKWTIVPRAVVVGIALILALGLAIVGLFGTNRVPTGTLSAPSTISDLALNVALELGMLQGLTACGFWLVRRIRRASRSKAAISSPLPPGPPVHP